MRTTLNIKNEFIEEVIKITGDKNKSKAINKALEQFVRESRIKKLLSLKGKLHLEENWQKLRDMELDER
jgi:Arc/MetJ family transcription regulator